MTRLAMICLFAWFILFGAAASASAATTVQVVGTEPAGENITLGRNQNFYLRLQYQSDQPVHIWARPYYQGEPADAGNNPSRVYPAGSGEALGWFFLFKPGDRVDEVRITAGDGSLAGTSVVATYPVQIIGGDAPAVSQNTPDWVSRLGAQDKAARQAAYAQQMNTPVSAGDVGLFNGFMLTMLAIGMAGFAAPAWGLWRWQGGWRMAAAVPAIIMGFVVLRIIVDTQRDPTSHNLWPFEILMAGALSAAIMGGLKLARKYFGEDASS
ncbi:hypothetical protein [Thiomonas bhubaneswarensis]|uniref:DUF4436 domain-containing protein n=1 Tax=Thiomonas bhubaneswarensis TaxID=339866 RepID=A0A0K6I8N2_9BURK|nr:hypothetical protein [Thiomonas bhubaneswarensis]CUA99485.1 hypothetical protein Ga0061069_109138 [Thiomonas bhubaneswarensis]